MHTMRNHYDGAPALKPIVERASIPFVDLSTDQLRARVGHRAEWIIDQRYMRAAPHDRAANAAGEIRTASVSVPPAARLAVLCKTGVEDLGAFRRSNQVADVAAEVLS